MSGVAVLALALAAGSTGANADSHEAPPSYVESWLALSTGSSNTVELVDAETRTRTGPQTLTGGKACSMNQGDKSLLEFAGSGLGTGLSGGSIGVREKKNASGTSCSAVDAASNETLTLKVNVPNLVAASASLDIDLKQSARILATARVTDSLGVEHKNYFELQSGASIGLDPLMPEGPTGPEATVFQCNNPADSGPDSGLNNNCRWQISGPSWISGAEDGVAFETLELMPVTGSFSLMGGADGAVADPLNPMPAYFGSDQDASIIELVEGVLYCGETATLRGAIPSSWTRLANLGTQECSPYAYATSTGFESDGKPYAEVVKPLDSETTAQALWTTTFEVGGGSTPPPVTMELDLPGGGTTGEFTLEPCPSTWYDSDGVFVGPPPDATLTAPYACLVSAEKGTGKLSKSATYVAYVYGDARLRLG